MASKVGEYCDAASARAEFLMTATDNDGDKLGNQVL